MDTHKKCKNCEHWKENGALSINLGKCTSENILEWFDIHRDQAFFTNRNFGCIMFLMRKKKLNPIEDRVKELEVRIKTLEQLNEHNVSM